MISFLRCFLIACCIFIFAANTHAQNVAINGTGAPPNASAMLDISSTTSGLLIPRMTTAQRTAIAAPATGLTVYDTTTNSYWYFDGTVWVQMAASGGWLVGGNNLTVGGIFGSLTNQDIIFYSNNTERMRLLSSGAFGIGTNAPAASNAGLTSVEKLNVFSSTTPANAGLAEISNNSNNGITLLASSNTAGYVTNCLVGGLQATTNSGLSAVFGLCQPTAANANIGVRGAGNHSNNYAVRGAIPTTGTWLGYGGLFTGGLAYQNGLYNLSDRRVKKDVTPMTNSLSKIMQLQGVTYKYNTDVLLSSVGDTRTYLGFIAQDVESVLPEVIATKRFPLGEEGPINYNSGKDEKYLEDAKVVDYVQIIPLLVEAIKEQQKEIDYLKSELKKVTR